MQLLKDNNSRDWFQRNQETYRMALEEPARQLLGFVEDRLP
ncbi:DUF2461 family protein [bacterium]|nr:DUF2461 family protein [bacterium]